MSTITVPVPAMLSFWQNYHDFHATAPALRAQHCANASLGLICVSVPIVCVYRYCCEC